MSFVRLGSPPLLLNVIFLCLYNQQGGALFFYPFGIIVLAKPVRFSIANTL